MHIFVKVGELFKPHHKQFVILFAKTNDKISIAARRPVSVIDLAAKKV